jgi:hypothetical protein
MLELLRKWILHRIKKNGEDMGAPPPIDFDEKNIVAEGWDLSAGGNWFLRLLNASAFYLSLPPNAKAVVIYPNGSMREMEGGLHMVSPGLYHLKFVASLERFVVTAPIGELTRDGEKLSLQFLIRYQVIAPVAVLRIDDPITALIEYIQTDIAQYIRTRDHNEIADAPNENGESRMFAFFNERHKSRHPLSDAIAITGVELKEFTGDKEHVDLRRNELYKQKQDQIDRERLERQRSLELLQERISVEHAKHKAELEKMISQAAAENQASSSQILRQSKVWDAQLEDFRTQSQRRYELLAKAMDAIGQALEPSGGYSRNNVEIKGVVDELLAAVKEDSSSVNILQETSSDHGASVNTRADGAHASSDEKIGNLTNTLLNLLNSKK